MTAPVTQGKERKSLTALRDVGDYVKCYYAASANALGTFSVTQGLFAGDELPAFQPLPYPATAHSWNVSALLEPNGYFYLIKIGEEQGRSIVLADRIIQIGIEWSKLKEAGFMDCEYQCTLGTGSVASRNFLQALSQNTVLAEDMRNTFHAPQSNFGWMGGYEEGWNAYHFNLADYDKKNWIFLEITTDEISENTFSAIFDWQGELSENYLLAHSERGSVGYYVAREQSKALSSYYLSDIGWGSGITLYTGFRPMFTIESKVLYQKGDSIYGMQGGNLQKLSEKWEELDDVDKSKVIESVEYRSASVDALELLADFKILTCSSKPYKASVIIDAVPKEQIVLPRLLRQTEELDDIIKTEIQSNLSEKSCCKVIVTTDLITYQTYDFKSKEWKEIDEKDTEAIKLYGIDVAELLNIDLSGWKKIIKGNFGIAFAYLISIEEIEDICAVDQFEVVANVKGRWEKI